MSSGRTHMGRWFEDLTPGLVIDHAVTRTVNESDNTLFSVLTMNPQPLHLDESFAATTEFGTTVANLGFEELAFPFPVFPGDTIHAQSEVVSSRPSASRPGQGVVVFDHRGFNQRDELVARCRRSALMLLRPQ
jgi:acyl dehydratase